LINLFINYFTEIRLVLDSITLISNKFEANA